MKRRNLRFFSTFESEGWGRSAELWIPLQKKVIVLFNLPVYQKVSKKRVTIFSLRFFPGFTLSSIFSAGKPAKNPVLTTPTFEFFFFIKRRHFCPVELGSETEAKVILTECACDMGCPVGSLGCTCARSDTSVCVQCVGVDCPCVACLSAMPAVCTRCTPVFEEKVRKQLIWTISQRWADRYLGPLIRCPADYRNDSDPADW